MKFFDKYLPVPSSPYQHINARKGLLALGFLLALCEVCNILGFLPFRVHNVILAGIMIIPAVVFGISRGSQFTKLYIFYLAYLAMNILSTDPPAVFRSWFRLGLFAVLLLCVSPVIQNRYMRKFRFHCFNYLMRIAVPLAVASFFCYFLGINYNRMTSALDWARAGHFSGLFQNSMLLGPVSAVSACYSFWAFLNENRKWWLVLFILCMGACFFSASRSAVYGAAIGCMCIILVNNKGLGKRIRQLLIIGVMACATFPFWQGALSGINQKNAANKELGEYGSRTEKFEARMQEIESSPVVGIGFASIDPKGRDVYDTQTGVVEPGSSWLAVFSMTGIFGFLFVLTMYFRAFTAARRSPSKYGALFAGLMAYSAFHELFEGYMMAAGSTLCFISWLIVGVASDLKYAKYN